MKRNDTDITGIDATTERVLVALRRIIRASDIQSKRLRRDTGLSGPQIVVLKAVRDLGEVTSRAIADHVSLSPGTITLILDKLEAVKLVERYRSSKDRRVVHTRLTRQGKATLRQAPPLMHDRFVSEFGHLSDSEQMEIVAALDSVAEMMGTSDAKVVPLLMADAAPTT